MKEAMKKKIDATLLDLCLGIVLYGIACQMIILIFSAKSEYSIGLWIGIVLGVIGSIHMWWAIDRSLDMVSQDAAKSVTTQSIVRYLFLVVVMFILASSGFANPLFAFLGYMGMKAGAYMQPFIHKISSRIFKL